MNLICRAIKKYHKNPRMFFFALANKILVFFSNRIHNDETYLKFYYRLRTGKKLNLSNPKTFNEKTQWIKLYDRKPVYTSMVDKYDVLEFVRQKIGEQYIIPLLGVWHGFDEIDFDKLPNQFVLKCTHDSGGVVICRDKEKLDFIGKVGSKIADITAAREKINNSLKRNYFIKGREWSYKHVPKRIIAQKYIKDEAGGLLQDYKIFTFNGKPKYVQVHFSKSSEALMANFYSTDWVYQDFYIEEISDKSHHIEKPKRLDEMLRLAEILAEGTYFLRVDFFYVNDCIYFGELTFYNWGGYGKFNPKRYDELFGGCITLPYEVR